LQEPVRVPLQEQVLLPELVPPREPGLPVLGPGLPVRVPVLHCP
jgi:hypothetical protein